MTGKRPDGGNLMSRRHGPRKRSSRTKKARLTIADKKERRNGLGGKVSRRPTNQAVTSKRNRAFISKLRLRLSQIGVKKQYSKDIDTFERTFQRSPGPPPTSSLIPPPSFFSIEPDKY